MVSVRVYKLGDDQALVVMEEDGEAVTLASRRATENSSDQKLLAREAINAAIPHLGEMIGRLREIRDSDNPFNSELQDQINDLD